MTTNTTTGGDQPTLGLVTEPGRQWKHTAVATILHPGRVRFVASSMPTDVEINGCMIDHLAFPVDVIIHEDGSAEVIEE